MSPAQGRTQEGPDHLLVIRPLTPRVTATRLRGWPSPP